MKLNQNEIDQLLKIIMSDKIERKYQKHIKDILKIINDCNKKNNEQPRITSLTLNFN